MQSNSELLPLDLAERTVAIKDRGQVITYTFRRLTSDDWARYMSGIVIETERRGGAVVNTMDTRTAADDLIKSAIVRVHGYVTRDGRRVDEVEGWKDNLPYRHTIPAVNLLQEVSGSKEDRPIFFDAKVEEVLLDAVWDPILVDDKPSGQMKKYTGLVHRLSRPTPEQKKLYNRSLAESRVVGGARNGRTIHGGRHRTLSQLYDEMIVEVEGYAANGQPLTGRSAIVQQMDYTHKVTAIDELFSTADVTNAEDE